LHATEKLRIALTRELITEDDALKITLENTVHRAFVRVQGRIGIDSSPSLRDRLLTLLQGQPPQTIVVDLAQVSSIDASGIATLLEALKVARSRNTTLCLQGLQGRMIRLFTVTGLLPLFESSGCEGSSAELR
jgi:anti-sigma B factor antagonist